MRTSVGITTSGSAAARLPRRPLHSLVRSPAGARCQPFLERRLALTRRESGKQSLNADVFIQVRPMDTEAASNKSPVVSLLRCPALQTRIPHERRCDRSAVDQVDDQCISRHPDLLGPWCRDLTRQNTHATTSVGVHDVLRPTDESALTQGVRIQRFGAVAQDLVFCNRIRVNIGHVHSSPTGVPHGQRGSVHRPG